MNKEKKFSIKKLLTGKGGKILGAIESIVPTVFKDHSSKLSSKRIFKILGGGSLITLVSNLVFESVESNNELGVYAGFGMIALGALIGIVGGWYMKENQQSTNEKPEVVKE
jgi:hypothetical protein